MRRAISVIGALAALAWGLAPAPAAATPVTIGAGPEIESGAAPLASPVGGVYLQSAAGTGHVYTVPAGYPVITAWRHRAGTTSGTLVFKVYRPVGTNSGYYVTLASEPHHVTAGVNEVFPTRILVQPGDMIGISSTDGVELVYPGAPGNVVSSVTIGGIDTEVGQMVIALSNQTGLLDVVAVLEPDADGDWYGDDTQDGCPTDRLTHEACLVTRITKAPPRRVYTRGRKATVKIAFTSANPIATFQCSVDVAPFRACGSPYLRKYRIGPHVVSVRSVDSSGVPGMQMVTVKFKVVHRGH